MGYKSILLTILATAIGFGTLIAGCKNDRDRVAMTSRRNQGSQARPAEVLSASAYRPPAREYYASMPARAQQPRPVQIYAAAPAPAYAPVPIVSQPRPVIIHPTPALVMARASMPPPRMPRQPAGSAVTTAGYAPIPELEPALSRPVVALAPMPVREMIPVSARYQGGRGEVQRALAPLPQTQSALQPLQPLQLTQQGWVSSPATAMRAY